MLNDNVDLDNNIIFSNLTSDSLVCTPRATILLTLAMSICPEPTEIQETTQTDILLAEENVYKANVPHPKLFTKSSGQFVVQPEPLCYQTNCATCYQKRSGSTKHKEITLCC